MVYISGDGTVCQSPPWNLDRVVRLFYGAVTFVVFFFKSLVGLDTSSTPKNSRTGGSSFRGSGGGGGGGGGGGRPFGPGGGGGGGGPSKRIMTMKDINPPTVSGGGCPGGSCGM